MLLLRMASTMLLARLLSPSDHGLIAMVTVITGFVAVFKDAGLSMATVQHEEITHHQVSTLFWINVGIGAVLMTLLIVAAPFVAAFYQDPRLVSATMLMSTTLLLGGLSVQHGALLHRQMRFGTKIVIELVAQLSAVLVAVAMALAGWGYWSLVGLALTATGVSSAGAWAAVRWIPGLPRRKCGVRSLLRYGGNLTGSNVLNYFARNADNILIGWAWGAAPLGFYSKAYQILLLPINQITGPIATVAIPAMARLRSQPRLLCQYFLSGYGAVVSVVFPLVVVCSVFAQQLVRIVLGPAWNESVLLFELLVPAALAGALMSPMGWVLAAIGRADRHLRVALVVCPLIVVSFVVGLPFGPRGVAASYSAFMVLSLFPTIRYMIDGTEITLSGVMSAVKPAFWSALPSSALAYVFDRHVAQGWHPLVSLSTGSLLVFASYILVLVGLMGQGEIFAKMWQRLSSTQLKSEGAPS